MLLFFYYIKYYNILRTDRALRENLRSNLRVNQVCARVVFSYTKIKLQIDFDSNIDSY